MPPWDAPELRAAAWPISIELDGHYPDTTVIVTMGYVYRRSPRQHRYPIWKAYTDHGLAAQPVVALHRAVAHLAAPPDDTREHADVEHARLNSLEDAVAGVAVDPRFVAPR